MPMRKSRAEPKRRRKGPLHPTARRPPMVWPGELKGSMGRNWPLRASSAWTASRVMPASTLTTMSAGECSITRSRPEVCSSTSHRSTRPPIPLARRPPTGTTTLRTSAASHSTRASSSSVLGFSTATRGPRELTAQPLSSWGKRSSPPLRLDREPCTPREAHLGSLRIGKDLARVQHAPWVERALDPLHGLQVVGGEDPGHERALLEADPVLTGKRAAHLDDRAQHLLAGAFDLVEDFLVTQVEQAVRMQVAVARVKHVRDRQLVVLADLADRGQHLRQAR